MQPTSTRRESLRQRLPMTQTEFASLLGVSQAAVSQFESGSRSPGGRTSAFHDRLEAAIASDVLTETIDGRTTTMPAHRWTRVIDPSDVGTVSLPARLDWSPRMLSGWDHADEVHRREIYGIVMDVGDALDMQMIIDPDEVMKWSGDLDVARRVRPAFDRLIERLAAATARA